MLLLKETGWKLKTLHRNIEELFEENAVTYLTLLRTIHGQTKLRESTLFQIASALRKTPEEIRRDTEEEEKFTHYRYNKKAYLEIGTSGLDFLAARLILLPGAKTETEQDPAEKGNFIKWLYGLRGEITCIVITGNNTMQTHVIRRNESFHFHSTQPHYFENNTSQKAACLLIQNPKYI